MRKLHAIFTLAFFEVVACATAGGEGDDSGIEDVIQPGFDANHPDAQGMDSAIDHYIPPVDSSVDNAVPDAGADVAKEASCPTCSLRVQYLCADTNATDNQLKPHYQIINEGTSPQVMDELTVRYWYTIDGYYAQSYYCDYALVGCSNISGAFYTMNAAVPEAGADTYMEISFSAGAGSIGADASSGEIQNRFNKTNYATINQANDYSFDPTKTSYADWDRVTLYKNGILVWGIEP